MNYNFFQKMTNVKWVLYFNRGSLVDIHLFKPSIILHIFLSPTLHM
jgi:hypothetical protein